MKTSDAGMALIQGFEGFSATPYKDGAGLMTIGYGHKLKLGELFDQISEDTALELLRDDLQEAEDAINRLVTTDLNQNQFDALVSFTFNLGCGAFQGSTLLKLLNAGDYQGAAEQFKRWKYAAGAASDGLLRRRFSEQNLFNTPVVTV